MLLRTQIVFSSHTDASGSWIVMIMNGKRRSGAKSAVVAVSGDSDEEHTFVVTTHPNSKLSIDHSLNTASNNKKDSKWST